MRHDTDSVGTSCPYCGEPIEVVVDLSVAQQDYIEDCQVCCRPIEFAVSVSATGAVELTARHENE